MNAHEILTVHAHYYATNAEYRAIHTALILKGMGEVETAEAALRKFYGE